MKITTTAVRAGALWSRGCLGLAALGVSVAFLAAPAALADPADPVPPTPAPAEGTTQMAAADPSAPVDGMPHLSSPDNLPPDTTEAPAQGRGLGYLRDLWHAMHTQDVTMSDAWLLLAQRPLKADATPPPGLAQAPSGPIGSSAPATVDPAPGPDTP